MDTGSFIIHIKIEDLNEDITYDIEQRFDTSNYEVRRPLRRFKRKNYDRICRTMTKTLFLLNG